ncbi:MAG: hypothetical protein V1827_02980 [Candidatus Micrarchaeota archaeon]
MEKKHVKWAAFVSLLFPIVAFLGILAYVLTPLLVCSLLGAGTACTCEPSAPPSGSGPAGLMDAMSELCFTAQSFFGIIVMVGILACGPLAFLCAAVCSFDVFSRKDTSGEKVKRLALIWLALGFGSFIYYWLVRRKEA